MRGNRITIGDSALAERLRREIEGEVLFDPFARGRYSTDASVYQIEPIGVVVPKSEDDLRRIVGIAADSEVPILPRGGGSSQNGQAINEALVIDTTKYLDEVLDFSCRGDDRHRPAGRCAGPLECISQAAWPAFRG